MSEAMDQASSYLLGELGAAETEAFERRLAENPALRDEVERLRPVVTGLEGLPEEAWDPPEPPPLRMPDETGRGAAAPRLARRRGLPTLTLRPVAAAGLGVGLASSSR